MLGVAVEQPHRAIARPSGQCDRFVASLGSEMAEFEHNPTVIRAHSGQHQAAVAIHGCALEPKLPALGEPSREFGQTIQPSPSSGLHLGETIGEEFGDNDHQSSISAVSNEFQRRSATGIRAAGAAGAGPG